MASKNKKIFTNRRPSTPIGVARDICQCCGKQRAWSYETKFCFTRQVPGGDASEYDVVYQYTGDVRPAGQWYGNDRFCSLKCCERFAAASHRAGYRIKEVA